MVVELNMRAVEHARLLIFEGAVSEDEREDASGHRPSDRAAAVFIEENGFEQYGRWFLGIDYEKPAGTRERYSYPIGELRRVHRCALIAAETRAREQGQPHIEAAARELLHDVDAEGPLAAAY